MSNNPQILIIDGSNGFTGAYKSIISITGEIKNLYDFHFAVSNKSSNKTSPHKVHKINFIEISKNLNSILFYFPMLIYNSIKLIKIINKYQIKLVHVNDIYNMLGVIIKILRPKTIVVYHVRLLPSSYISPMYGTYKYLISKYSDHIICVSNAVSNNFKNTSKVVVLHDTINQINETKIIKPKKNISILYLANYTKGKGQEYAISAFSKASKKIDNISITFAGGFINKKANESFQSELILLAKGKSCSDKIKFRGFISDPTDLILNSEILLNFSDSESFSLTVLESISIGTPCIVTDSGGPSEIVENGISGKVIPCRDINAMADAIVELSSSLELRKIFNKNGIARAREKFNITKHSVILSEIYDGLLISTISN